jgi:4-carboxymuconolactone decarboxylase
MHTFRSSPSAVLVKAAILASTGNTPALKRLLKGPLIRTIRIRKLVETLLEVHLFAGFPATIEAMFILREVRPGRALSRKVRDGNRSRAGIDLMRKVYGKYYSKVSVVMKRLSPDLSAWIINHGYGTVLCRRGLSLRERELVAIGVLAALGWERQLRSHIKAALALRIPAPLIEHVLCLALKFPPAHRQGSQDVTIQRVAGDLQGKSA